MGYTTYKPPKKLTDEQIEALRRGGEGKDAKKNAAEERRGQEGSAATSKEMARPRRALPQPRPTSPKAVAENPLQQVHAKVTPQFRPSKAHEQAEEANAPKQQKGEARPSTTSIIIKAAVDAQFLWYSHITKPVLNAVFAPLMMTGCGPGGETYVPPGSTPPISPTAPAPSTSSSAPIFSQQPGGTIEAPQQKVKYWWPAFIMKNNQLMMVYLGYGDDTFYDPKDMYASKDAIPKASIDDMRMQIQDMLAYMQQFMKDPQSVTKPLEGVILMKMPTPVKLPNGSYAAGGYGATNPVMVQDSQGNELKDYAGGGKVLDYEKNGKDAGKVLFHEFLHLISDQLPAQDFAAFKAQSQGFYGAYSKSVDTDLLVTAVASGIVDPAQVQASKTKGTPASSWQLNNMVNSWASQTLSSLSQDDQSRVKLGVWYYLNMFNGVIGTRTQGMTQTQRDSFMYFEAFAFMGANYPVLDSFIQGNSTADTRFIPEYMNGIYKQAGMKAEVVEELSANYPGFTTQDDFKKLAPYIKQFVDFVVMLYPDWKKAWELYQQP